MGSDRNILDKLLASQLRTCTNDEEAIAAFKKAAIASGYSLPEEKSCRAE